MTADAPVQVLLLSGSLRAGSTNTALLQTAQAISPSGLRCTLYAGLASLPPFNPDDDHEPLHPAVVDLRRQVAQASALLVCTPEYAGGLPGSFKNLLDWLVGGGEGDRKPVAWINAAGPGAPTGAADAHRSLSTVLGYLGADLVEEACVRVPVLRQQIGLDGLIQDPEVQAQVAAVLESIAARVRADRAAL
ncbi:NADPH-dependent FMN reductase [Deinococcus sonorensis]|uniref:NADPH-dependent FMN reductase n=2 Tax=Deinococcus sonorensis TaxID=309891 RepID=A0AAU7UAN1_9DEIO